MNSPMNVSRETFYSKRELILLITGYILLYVSSHHRLLTIDFGHLADVFKVLVIKDII